MKYFLSIDRKMQGPYTPEQIRKMLESGSISSDTLAMSEDAAGDWSPIGNLLDMTESPKPEPPEPTPTAQVSATAPAASYSPSSAPANPSVQSSGIETVLTIQRRSDWSWALRFLGAISFSAALCLLAAASTSALPDHLRPSIPFIVVACVVAGVQALLFAFLVDVFTDIRWFLQKISDRDDNAA